ncbi:hypothetical protein DRW03_16500 [Corallococcus sp. H22C18031201]|nr:hypothetical protein DRW03_16500 [Corallococcus sp. H22C18031201]
MQLRRRPWLHLLAVSLLSWGCSSKPTPPPDPETPTPEWDGTAVPLEELGDVIDAGTPSACGTLADAGPGVECGDLAAFDLSGCNRASLAQVPAVGIFQGGVGSVAMQGDAGTFVSGLRGELYRDATSLHASMTYVTKRNFHIRTAIAACEAPNPDLVKVCVATCRDGKLMFLDRGDLNRIGKVDNQQPVSEGGINLASESYVAMGEPVDVYVTHDHAYVVSIDGLEGTGGLTIFDVRDRAHPVFKKQIRMDGDSYWNAVWATGDTLYIGSNSHGVLVYDIHDPANPQYLRAVGGDTINVHTFFVDGDILYAMSPMPAPSVFVFDIKKPNEPVLLQKIVIPLSPTAYPTAYPHDAFAYQGRLYVNNILDGYVILDVTNPSVSTELGAYRFEGSLSHANAVGTFAGRTIAFEGGEGIATHLRVLDVTDPAHIVKIGEYQLGNSSIHNMILRGKRLYVAYYQEGVRVLDVSNPTQPKEIARYSTYRDTDPFRVGNFLEGSIGMRVPGDGFVYVVDTSRGLLIFNEL